MGRNMKLVSLRTFHQLSQEQIAKKLNLSTRSYQEKETGIRPFKQKEINRLLEIFESKYEDIFLIQNSTN